MSEIVMDLGGVYRRVKEVARAAVAGAPGTSYGLEDVMPEDAWMTVATSPLVSLVPVYATLSGCIEALNSRGVTAAEVERVRGAPPAEMAVSPEDMRTARSWLADALAADLDEEGCQGMVDREAIDREWVADAVRVTSLVVALVLTAGAAAADH